MKKLLCIILLLLCLTANVGQAQFNDSEPMFGQQLNLGHWSTDGLVFYWRGIPAGYAVDESFGRNDGTLVGSPVWVGQGLDFDGSADYIDVTGLRAGYITLPATTIIWFKCDVLPSTTGDEYTLIRYATPATNQERWQIRVDDGDDKLEGTVEGGTAFKSTAAITAGKWHQAILISYANNSHQIFLDTIAGETNATAFGGAGATPELRFGVNYFNGLRDYMKGQIADIKIYNRALSPSEIADLSINPDLPMQQQPIWLMYSPGEPPSGIVPIIQAHTRRRRAG